MMSKYTPNGKTTPSPAPSEEGQGEERIRVNGFGQVLDMLKTADPEFRMSLLRRLAAKDRELARQLTQDLRALGLI